MILIAGAGGMAHAAAAMRREQRRIDARIRRFKEKRRNKRMAKYNPITRGVDSGDVDLDCYWLCSACGYMQPSGFGKCPHCESEAILDLNRDFVVSELEDLDEDARYEVPSWVEAATAAPAFVAGGLGLLAGPVAAGALLAAGLVAYRYARKPAAAALATPTMPMRWTWPLNAPDEDTMSPKRLVTGEAEATPGVSLLTAPLSGKPCLAYEVSVLFDAEGDAWPPVWICEETRNVAFRVGDHPIEAGELVLHMNMEEVDEPEDLSDFLRARGLREHDGWFVLYEERVSPGDRVSVAVYDGAAAVCFPPK